MIVLRLAGKDYLMIDARHYPMSKNNLLQCLQAKHETSI